MFLQANMKYNHCQMKHVRNYSVIVLEAFDFTWHVFERPSFGL